jgi:hypothetical protein
VAHISESAFAVADTLVVELEIVISISPAYSLGCGDNRSLVLFSIVSHFTMLAPPALSVALLAELLRLELTFVCRVVLHLIDFIKRVSFGSHCGVRKVLSIPGSFRVVVAEVGVLLFELVLQLKNLIGSISESPPVFVVA